MSLISEISEQPAVLEKQLKSQKAVVMEIAEAIRGLNPSFVYTIARGTSEHAGIYAQYLLGIQNHLPMVLAAPSMSTFYHSAPRTGNALAVAISQSGKSPDLIAAAEDSKAEGAKLLVITNTPDSPLGKMGDYVIDCCAGPELATAATKSYTTSLMAFAMLSAALKGDENMWAELEKIPERTDEMFACDEPLAAFAERYVHAQRCVVLGRGYNFASAKEFGLKLQELTYMMAEPYSSAVFQHGPIAMVDRGFPIFSFACCGEVLESQIPQMLNIRENLGGDIFVITNSEAAAKLANRSVLFSDIVPEWLTPIPAIIPAQLFAHHLCFARGFDTEHPRTIAKVTETH